jgi:activator of 2-hydroxyglutaryl-CoA dehydratase
MTSSKYIVGFDLGSTTVKAVIRDADTDEIVWKDYQRHDSKQAQRALLMLKQMESDVPGFRAGNARVFITGSGGSNVGRSHRRQVRAGGQRRLARRREAATPRS